MSNESQKSDSIPTKWRATVASILRAGDKRAIIVRDRPRIEFEARFPDAWSYERNEAMASALEQSSIVGKNITTMKEPGEVWAFWFHFRNEKLYGKINLTPQGKIIIIYSAHVPNKGDQDL